MDRRTFVGAIAATMAAARLRVAAQASADSPAADTGGAVRPLFPIPAAIAGTLNPCVPLNGSWDFTAQPEKEFWMAPINPSHWSKIEVPCEFALQGFTIVEDVEYPCHKTVTIPPDFAAKRIFLRFDGVYGYARVWVNGTYLRDHFGGFTSWDCEVTQLAKAGQTIEIVVGVTDRRDDISQASYYAHHSIAGILREVRLFALPANGLDSFSAEARLEEDLRTGHIHLTANLASTSDADAHLELRLTDGFGKTIATEPPRVALSKIKAQEPYSVRVQSPILWDAEHPNLYGLEVHVVVDGVIVQTQEVTLGFRTVKTAGNQLLVNGKPVKLRGACRHSIHPIYGRALPPMFDEQDALLFRGANINFIRTSHYPPTEQFLAACDRHGIYLEEETAVCWSNVGDGSASDPAFKARFLGQSEEVSSDPAFKARFLGQFEDMIERDRHHASVIFWSLGNESQWGENFASERRYAKEADPSRPVIFSYPETIPWASPRCDIHSKHYPESDSNLGSSFSPVLHDEFAHVNCYDVETYRRDPGVRNFWGESIKIFGDRFLSSEGCLGGAIWAGIDEVFLLPSKPVGYGPWGIVDGWRREKPEYWLTKKAFSPIRIVDRSLPSPVGSNPLEIAIYNAFDHTNLNELDIHWTTSRKSGRLSKIDLPPRSAGYLSIPAQDWKPGDTLDLKFFGASNFLIDHFNIPIGAQVRSSSGRLPQPLAITEMPFAIVVHGENFNVQINRETGLIANATCDGQTVIEAGPFLDLGKGYFKGWTLRQFDLRKREDGLTIFSSGESRVTEGLAENNVDFEIDIDGTGLITTRYRTTGSSMKPSHLGIAYLLPGKVVSLRWERKALWSVYPEDHIGRPSGIADRRPNHPPPAYRVTPSWPWSQDAGDAYDPKIAQSYPDTHDFCSIKENVWSASCVLGGGRQGVTVEADAEVAVRASSLPDERVALSIFNFWSYPDMVWGNYTGPRDLPAQTVREVKLRLTDRPPEAHP